MNPATSNVDAKTIKTMPSWRHSRKALHVAEGGGGGGAAGLMRWRWASRQWSLLQAGAGVGRGGCMHGGMDYLSPQREPTHEQAASAPACLMARVMAGGVRLR